MSRKGNRTLLGRLTLVQISVFATLWLIVILLTIFSTYQHDRGDIEVELKGMASTLARLAATRIDGDISRLAAEYAAADRERSDPPLQVSELAYRISTAEGRIVAQSGSLPASPDWYVQSSWSPDHSVHVLVGKRASYYHRRVGGTVVGLLVMWLVMAVLFAAAFRWSFGITIRPLRELARRVAARSDEDLSSIDESTYEEVRPLLTELNRKLAKIRALLERERQFFADAAHELRTPLSVIGAQAHVLAHESSLEQRLEALRHIEGGIARGAQTVSRLLLLARLESPESTQHTDHDLVVLIGGAVAAHQTRALASGHSLRFSRDGEVHCHCDAAQMLVLVDNLIDNALRYCPSGSSIHVTVRPGTSGAVICVSDDGPGIPVDDRERAFDRFQRLGVSDSVGSGLGLAIVRRIAALHKGLVQLGPGLGGKGLSVEIRLAGERLDGDGGQKKSPG
jgi:signal transduction histidine kinase